MNTDQARRIVAAHDAADTALRNLRNAAQMAVDDPGMPGMLEDAGDAYVATRERLNEEWSKVLGLGDELEELAEEAKVGPAPTVQQSAKSAPGAEEPSEGGGTTAEKPAK